MGYGESLTAREKLKERKGARELELQRGRQLTAVKRNKREKGEVFGVDGLSERLVVGYRRNKGGATEF